MVQCPASKNRGEEIRGDNAKVRGHLHTEPARQLRRGVEPRLTGTYRRKDRRERQFGKNNLGLVHAVLPTKATALTLKLAKCKNRKTTKVEVNGQKTG